LGPDVADFAWALAEDGLDQLAIGPDLDDLVADVDIDDLASVVVADREPANRRS